MLHAASIENQRIELFRDVIESLEFSQSLEKHLLASYHNTPIVMSCPSLFSFEADRFMLERVVIQLVDNSLKYNAANVHISFKEGGSEFSISVADDGSGINEADRPFIFDKFYRSGDENKREKPGTGLGLYIASQFIELHQGKIGFSENKPHGSIFTITLPK
jgi:signal transduction histidine kinase